MQTMERPVTGPDGDNPITDEQIRQLRIELATESRLGAEPERIGNWPICDLALQLPVELFRSAIATRAQIAEARTRCAAALNARHVVQR